MIDGAYDVRSQTKPNNEQHNICIWNTSERRAESWNGEVVYISWVESIKANPLCNHKEKQSRNRIECYNTQSHTHNFFGEKNDINSRKNGFSVNELYALSRLFLSISLVHEPIGTWISNENKTFQTERIIFIGVLYPSPPQQWLEYNFSHCLIHQFYENFITSK